MLHKNAVLHVVTLLGPLTKITIKTHFSVNFKSLSTTPRPNPMHMCPYRKIPKCTNCQLKS